MIIGKHCADRKVGRWFRVCSDVARRQKGTAIWHRYDPAWESSVMGHKRAPIAGILLRRSKGKGSMMTRIHWVTRGHKGGAMLPVYSPGGAECDIRFGADAFTRVHPAAQRVALTCADRGALTSDAAWLRRVVGHSITRRKGSSPEGTRRRSRLGRAGRKVEPGRRRRVAGTSGRWRGIEWCRLLRCWFRSIAI
jgi:hypothetical protein